MSEKITIQEHIDALRKIADELRKPLYPDSPPTNLWIHSRRKIIRAVRIFLATKGALSDCKGFTLMDTMSKMSGLKVDGADEVLLSGWMLFIFPWLRAQRPDRFGGDAGAFDLPPFKLDAKGKPIVKDGKVIRATADYDETAWRDHLQDQRDDWADACLALGDLLKKRLADNQSEAAPVNTPVSLRGFMKLFCTPLSDNLLDSRAKSLLKAAKGRGVNLPKVEGDWKRGQSKKYRPTALMKAWPGYRDKLPNLPELKQS